jgi:DeoR/GlpR family transcriptional regulator of sugar metabolism
LDHHLRDLREQGVRADLYFMGVTGVHRVAGLSTGDFEEATVKRALHARAAETIVLASSEKLGAASAFEIAPLSALAALVLPAPTPIATVKSLRLKGLKLLLAD